MAGAADAAEIAVLDRHALFVAEVFVKGQGLAVTRSACALACSTADLPRSASTSHSSEAFLFRVAIRLL